ncbi:transcriptional regulator, partial [Xanthomonas hyacinthi DSM 19077]
GAAVGYLGKRAPPTTPADLAGHRWIALTILASPTRWTFTGADGTEHLVQMRSAASANTTLAAHGFVVAGMGMSVLPDYVVADDLAAGRLLPLLA